MGPYRQFGQKGHNGQNGTLWTKYVGPNWILLTKWDKMEQN